MMLNALIKRIYIFHSKNNKSTIELQRVKQKEKKRKEKMWSVAVDPLEFRS